MRRAWPILLPVALLAALVALWPGWRDHAEPKRAARRPSDETVAPASPGDAAPDSTAVASSPEGAEALESQARVHGVVTGSMGVLWGARVVAYRPGTEQRLAETYTNPEGKYSLAVDASVDFDLAVEPAPETWLLPKRQRILVLGVGDDSEENFALGPAAIIRGSLVDGDGNGRDGIGILVVRPEDMSRDDAAHPNAVLGRQVASGRSGPDGAFRLGGLVAGTYALVIRDPEWMLETPVTVATDAPAVVLIVVPAISVDLEVRNIETERPVEAFAVKVTSEGRVVLEGWGAHGVFSRRVAAEGSRAPPFPEFEVTAPGFAPWGSGGATLRSKWTVWLLPLRDKNTTIRVSFDDGQPYRGRVLVGFKAKSGESAGRIPLECVEDGKFRGAMPYGKWHVQVRLESVFGSPRLEDDVDVADSGDTEVNLVLPAGGTLVLLPSPGAEPCCVYIRGQEEIERRVDGGLIRVPPEGARLEGVPPGLYQVGYLKDTKINERLSTHSVIWFRDVQVVIGSTEEIRVPAE